jgi:hypothetical protein
MREKFYIQKLWNAFMKKKMEKEMQNSKVIDDAFKEIKTATRVTDVQEMVKKFLTRESTYSQLLAKVSEFERHMENLKRDNDVLKERLHELHIDSQSGENAEANADKFQDDEEINELRETIDTQKTKFRLLQEKYKKINIVNDQVSGWAKKCYSKFSALTQDSALQSQPDDIIKVFSIMEEITVSELKERNSENPIEPDDTFIDFATEEFITKNIRVRPISGATHGDETKDGRQSNVSKGGGENDEDKDEKVHFEAIIELNEQRDVIKKKIEVYKAEQKKKKELEEKRAKKN